MTYAVQRGALTGLLLLAPTALLAGTIALDTEQKAAAGVSSGIFLGQFVTGSAYSVTSRPLEYADRALRAVRRATTVAALRAAKDWTTIACAKAGSISVRLTGTSPGLLTVRWNACAIREFGIDRTFNGPVFIALASDTLAPTRVPSIRLGALGEDFTEQVHEAYPDQITDTTYATNLRLRGSIATFDGMLEEGVPISSEYKVDGVQEYLSWAQLTDGRPPQASGLRVVADKLDVNSTVRFGMQYEETVEYTGRLTRTETVAPPWAEYTDRYVLNEFRVRQQTDYAALTLRLAVDGRIAVAWNPLSGSGCMDGEYAFRTRTPLLRNADSTIYDAGELVVNGSVVGRFYSANAVPPGRPTPVNGQALELRVRDVGTFFYDADSPNVLRTIGQCRL